MKIKLIALDLDDTLLRPNRMLSDECRLAIERAIAEGIEIVVASGRAFTALPEVVTKIKGIRYAVTSNGSSVNSMPDGKRLKAFTVSQGDILKTLEIIDEYYEDMAVEALIEGVTYSGREHVEHPEKYGCRDSYISYIQETRTPVEDIRGFIRERIHEIDNMNIACPDEIKREKTRKYLHENLREAYITSSVKHLTEISNANAGKGNGLKFVCEMLGISAGETASCGNGDNDIDMIKYTALGAAVSNASPSCLNAADIVVKSSSEDGVADFIHDICNGKYDIMKNK